MALFPAYGDAVPSTSTSLLTEIYSKNVHDEKSPTKDVDLDVTESNKDNQSEENCPKIRKKKKKKIKKYYYERKKPRKTKKHDEAMKNKNDLFYLDNNLDYRYMQISRLRYPVKPKYNETSYKIMGKLYNVKQKCNRNERYFNITNIKHLEMLEKYRNWPTVYKNDTIMEKTEIYSKKIKDNPYDTDTWLEYIDFQEEIFNHELEIKNIASQASARSFCFAKQLSMLDVALKNNYNSVALITKKVKIWEISLPNDDYIRQLKSLLAMSELSTTCLKRAWLWYLDGVKYSMAICSTPTIKDVYAAAIKALSRVERESFQKSHSAVPGLTYVHRADIQEITYRLGLFLRQAGLWEQLLMLVKLNVEINLVSKDGGSLELQSNVNMVELMDEENKILASGLPLHVVWTRIELLRSKSLWIPSREETSDPQRVVFSTDYTDFIKTVSDKSEMFRLSLSLLRLLKVPFLPISHALMDDLTSDSFPIAWENDCIENILPFYYCLIMDLDSIDQKKFIIMSSILKDFSDEPNYFDSSGEYFKFVSYVMCHSINWFDNEEQTAIILWWIRLMQIVIATTASYTTADKMKKQISSIKKSIKEVLKKYSANTIIYVEYALLEAQVSGIKQGIVIIENCLKSLPCERNIYRVHSVKCYVETLLKAKDLNTTKCLSLLSDLANNVPICDKALDDEQLSKAEIEFTEYTDLLLLFSDKNDKINIVSYMIPNMTIDWICCHGWYLTLTQNTESLLVFYMKVLTATYVDKNDKYLPESKIKLHVREGFYEWILKASHFYRQIFETIFNHQKQPLINVWESALEEFPNNSFIIWKVTGNLFSKVSVKWKLSNLIKRTTTQGVAIALVLQNFINLYRKYDPTYSDWWQPGNDHRLNNLLLNIVNDKNFKKCSLIWRMLIEFTACHSSESTNVTTKLLFQALDECPWNKALYYIGCVRVPSEFSNLIDIMLEKQIRLHAMPEELQPL